MNDKIKEIMQDAWDYDTNSLDEEKFAELLIREAAHLIETRDPRVEPTPHIYLLKAFGICNTSTR